MRQSAAAAGTGRGAIPVAHACAVWGERDDLGEFIVHDHRLAHGEVRALSDHLAFGACPRRQEKSRVSRLSTRPAQTCSRVNLRSPLGFIGTVAVEKIMIVCPPHARLYAVFDQRSVMRVSAIVVAKLDPNHVAGVWKPALNSPASCPYSRCAVDDEFTCHRTS